jgi:tetratricopeptide (TPR) repeat protein/GTPase SAR1 family protein
MNNRIQRAIEEGRLMIFLGAGATTGCKDSGGRDLLLSDDLAELLATESAFDYADEPLSQTYAAAREKLGGRVDRILEERYKHCTPSPAYRTVAAFPWPRVYTTNIDDSFESALRAGSKQQLNIRLRNDRISDRDPFYSKLDFVKLNGSIDRLDKGLVFSPDEYARATAEEAFWHEELARDYFNHCFLFIGSSLREPTLRYHIERYRATSGDEEGESFVLTPNATEIEVSSLRRNNLTHIPGSIDDFAKWLRTTFPHIHTPEDLALKRFPQLTLFRDAKNAEKYAKVFAAIFPVSRATLSLLAGDIQPAGRIRDFYRGFKPRWRDILDQVPAELHRLQSFIQRAIQSLSTDKLLVVTGAAGSGKSTLLMQAALGLSDKSQLPTYYLPDPVSNFAEIVSALETSNSSRYILLTDKLDAMSEEISQVLSSGRARKMFLVGSERRHIWSDRTVGRLGEFCPNPFDMGDISENDAKRLLLKLEQFGPWTRLGGMLPADRLDELTKKARRQLLIGLLETTSGRGFEEIIESEFASLKDISHRLFFILVGLATVQRVFLPAALCARSLSNLGISQSPHLLARALPGIVNYDKERLTVRHPVYVRHVFERSIDKTEFLKVVKALIGAFTVYSTPVIREVGKIEGIIFKASINHRFLKEMLQADERMILDFYQTFEKPFEQDGLFWLQYGLALRDLGRQPEALEKLQTAYNAYRIEHTEHALAQQLLIMALECGNEPRALSYLTDAKGMLERLDRQPLRGGDTYPIVALSEWHTKIIRRYKGDERAREVARDYAKIIGAKLKSAPADERLKASFGLLTKFVETSIEPAELA